jgi:glycosyltransferase involved in cell wall biosynthesis
MDFSDDIASIGSVSWKKVIRLIRLAAAIVRARYIERADVLNYPPAGPNYVPVLRDIFLLILTRWMFRRVIFHFHAGGLHSFYERLPRPLRFFFRQAYFRPDVAVRTTSRNPEDTKFLGARAEFIVPNGIPDYALLFHERPKPRPAVPRVLHVGILREDKGTMVLIRACLRLWRKGAQFTLRCVGRFASEEFRMMVMDFIESERLSDRIEFTGTLEGIAKWQTYWESDIFCFPSFVNSETFGIVLVEALSFSLPVICTNWRGIPDVVDEECAFIVPIRDDEALAEKLEVLLSDSERRYRMGAAGRKRFLTHFTSVAYHGGFQAVFDHLRAELNAELR